MTKIIALEEHFVTGGILHAWKASAIGRDGTEALASQEIEKMLEDHGEGRLARMDESGVDVQVLSVTTPALHNLEPQESVGLARETNDQLAAVIAKHPSRYQGFATLPVAAPEEAAAELERCVRDLGFQGSMLCGRTREKNMDHPAMRPIYEAAAKLRVPLYIHPQIPQRAVREVYYSGFGDSVDTALASFGLGWHYEAGIQFVRLIVGGVLDEFPELQIVLGHWGEVVLFFAERLNAIARVKKLQRPIADYLRQNLYVTPSGMWSATYMRNAIEIVGPERVLFSVDYPYQYRPGGEARAFVERAALSEEDRELFAHGNWERLTGGIVR